MFHVSCVTCHLSDVKKMLFLFFFMEIKSFKKLEKLVELVCGGSVIKGAYPV